MPSRSCSDTWRISNCAPQLRGKLCVYPQQEWCRPLGEQECAARTFSRSLCPHSYSSSVLGSGLLALKSQGVWLTVYVTAPGQAEFETKPFLPARRTGKASWKRQPLSWALMAGQN